MPEEIVHPDLARRIAAAIDGNPEVPPLNHGRLAWFQKRFEDEGAEVGLETIRKWLAGATRPRHNAMEVLAKILKVDHSWLSTGKSPEFGDKEQRHHVAIAGGVVNLVAGFIQIDGGHPAFPKDEGSGAIHLFAVIRGAKYDFHIIPSIGEPGQRTFLVPLEAAETIILGVDRLDGFAVRIFELDWDTVTSMGTRKGGGFQVTVDGPWREIRTFANRL